MMTRPNRPNLHVCFFQSVYNLQLRFYRLTSTLQIVVIYFCSN